MSDTTVGWKTIWNLKPETILVLIGNVVGFIVEEGDKTNIPVLDYRR